MDYNIRLTSQNGWPITRRIPNENVTAWNLFDMEREVDIRDSIARVREACDEMEARLTEIGL